MTTHDVHRTMEENLFNTFHHRHNPLQSSSILGGPRSTGNAYPSAMSASDLITMSSRHQRSNRPNSDMYRAAHHGFRGHTTEAEAIDKMYEDIQRYEKMMDEAAAASLDQDFKDELEHVNQWFLCRSDPERTAALYTLVQNASQIQIRFLITVLQQRADPLGDVLSPAGQDKGPAPVAVAGSVVSTESQYEMRKQQMYPPSRRGTRSNLCNRLTSALSEPDDLRRRDLLVPTSLGSNLSQQGLLYEKALAARAQIQAANRAAAAAAASSNSASSTTSSTTASSTFSPRTSTSERTSLFGAASNDWPFHLARDRNSNGGRNGASNDGNSEWSFGSLSSSKKWSSRKSDTIREDHEEQHHSMLSSMAALEQAQARLRASKAAAAAAASSRHNNNHHQPSLHVTNTTTTSSSSQQQSPSTVLATPPSPAPVAATTKSTEPISSNSSPRMNTPSPAPPPGLEMKQQQQQQFGQFLVPPSDDGNNPGNDYLSDYSDMSNKGEQQLTGAARRRKRSSAARALKDKIAAETVDFELMKDVTNWLRSLRLHKYSPAFDGLVWQQVVQMTDEDMLRAGVNTLGARRKLLKVFENVMRHCDENGVDYKNAAAAAAAAAAAGAGTTTTSTTNTKPAPIIEEESNDSTPTDTPITPTTNNTPLDEKS
ncbi:hypothetical protein LRAMOSA10146 [Lichtheimia ramosa]|uniref:SAM domain-containing protein n=1 Tax=Lichtheimia ramosa TaxID=688394 RepID=A0A077WN32_9FUNG|nr:hypothetical protein LRAMOSA10146 [Lichtheimia ramosa]